MSTGTSGSASGYLTALFRAGTLSTKSDSELLAQFIAARSDAGESAELAFSVLLARHGAMVLKVCRGVLGDDDRAEDAFQATFLILASRARSIRRQVSIASWLYGVALRVAGSERSRTAQEATRAEARRDDGQGDRSSKWQRAADAELVRAIHEEIGLLPERFRLAVVLCYLEGLTHETAAERLGRPVGTVRSRLATARDRLRVRLTRPRLARRVVPAMTAPDNSDCYFGGVEEATVQASLKVALGKSARRRRRFGGNYRLDGGDFEKHDDHALGGAICVGTGRRDCHGRRRRDGCIGASSGRTPHRRAFPRVQAAWSRLGKKRSRTGPLPCPYRGTRACRAVKKQPAADGPIVVQAETVDEQGRPLSGVALGVSVYYAPRREPAESPMLQTVSNDEGRGRVEGIQALPGEQFSYASLWAYKPGRSLASTNITVAEKSALGPVRLVLDEPAKQTVTVVGSDGRPSKDCTWCPARFNARTCGFRSRSRRTGTTVWPLRPTKKGSRRFRIFPAP